LLLYERPTRRRAVLLGAVLGVTLMTDLYATVLLGIAVVALALWRWRSTFTRVLARRGTEAVVVGALVGSPVALAMLYDLATGWTQPLPDWGGAQAYSADIISWITPWDGQRFWGGDFHRLNVLYTGGERLAFPGFLTLALAVLGVVVARRRRGPWVTVFAVFFVLSLGPYVHVLGHTGTRFEYLGSRFSYPLPYALFHFLPV